jgi:acetyl esterase/lipase
MSTAPAAGVTEAIPVWRHPHLSFVDKILQYVARWMLGLAKLCTVEEAASIDVYRKRVNRLIEGPYGGIVKAAGWTVTKKTLTRADGTALDMLIHEPPKSTETCVLWIHGGGFILGTAKDAHGAQLMRWLADKTAAPFAWCSLE